MKSKAYSIKARATQKNSDAKAGWCTASGMNKCASRGNAASAVVLRSEDGLWDAKSGSELLS